MRQYGGYASEDKRKSYTNPTTKPFKGGFVGFKQKEWTVPQLIHYKLEKAAHFIKEIFLTEGNSGSTFQVKKMESNLETLFKDLWFMENSLKKDPFKFNKEKLKINIGRIQEMKQICDIIKKSVIDKNELKKLGKLEHLLTELWHILKPINGVKDVPLFKIGLNEMKKKSTVKPVKKTGTKKVVSTKTKAKTKKPVVKSAVKKKTKAVVKSKKVAVKSVRKPKVKAAVKKTVKSKKAVTKK